MVEDGVSRMEVVVAPGKKIEKKFLKNERNIHTSRPKRRVNTSFGPIWVLTWWMSGGRQHFEDGGGGGGTWKKKDKKKIQKTSKKHTLKPKQRGVDMSFGPIWVLKCWISVVEVGCVKSFRPWLAGQ